MHGHNVSKGSRARFWALQSLLICCHLFSFKYHGNHFKASFLVEPFKVKSWLFEQCYVSGINHTHNVSCLWVSCFFKIQIFFILKEAEYGTEWVKIFTIFINLLHSFLLPNKYDSNCSQDAWAILEPNCQALSCSLPLNSPLCFILLIYKIGMMPHHLIKLWALHRLNPRRRLGTVLPATESSQTST